MELFEVGSKISLLDGRPEGTAFEITEAGPIWFFNYADPTDQEIADVSEGSAFEIRSSVLNDVLWIFVKCGNQEWAEAPYNPHLSKAPALMPIGNYSSEGYALTLLMVDKTTQTIKHIRVIGLGNKFSRQLKRDVDALLARPFDKNSYYLAVQKAQSIYTTKQLVRQSKNYWRLS